MKKRIAAFLIAVAMTVGVGAAVYGNIGGIIPPIIPCPPEVRSIDAEVE